MKTIISNIKIKWWKFTGTIDSNGYARAKDGMLIHRKIAYQYIYIPQKKDSYPLPFSKYAIHHVDRDKLNDGISNLRILTVEEHNYAHRK